MRKYIKQLAGYFGSTKGKRFLHFCYSWGAALVLIGAMFKILHFPYANETLMVAMSLEALIFILSAFDFPAGQTAGKSVASPVREVREQHVSPDEMDYEETIRTLSRQMKRLTEFVNSINTVSDEIERQTFNYGVQIRQMGYTLRDLNAVYERLVDQVEKTPEDIHTEEENEILN